MSSGSNLAVSVERRRVYLHPGHSLFATEPTLVTTILGSCVSVCLWDEQSGIGGLTHYLLPRPLPGAADGARFGTTAIPQLVDQLRRKGAKALNAKIFGGSSMSSALAANGRDLGSQNAAVALQLLGELRIPIAAADTGGQSGRKLLFQTDDGTALVKYLEARS